MLKLLLSILPSFIVNLFFKKQHAKYQEKLDLKTELLNIGEQEETSPHLTSFSLEEKQLLKNAILLSESRVDDIMIPRAQIEALNITATLAQALEAFDESGYSRMPIYSETLDDPKGMIHIHDILAYLSKQMLSNYKKTDNSQKIDLSLRLADLQLIRDVLFIPSSMLANKLLQKMQNSRIQMALVIDEYGGTEGLVSLEDIVELLVGDIEDEHDDITADIVQIPNGGLIVNAHAELEEIQEILGEKFNIDKFKGEFDTIGGLIVTALGYIPVRGEIVNIVDGYRIRILEADRRRIKRLRIKPMESNQNNNIT